jgi:hypothetical protein
MAAADDAFVDVAQTTADVATVMDPKAGSLASLFTTYATQAEGFSDHRALRRESGALPQDSSLLPTEQSAPGENYTPMNPEKQLDELKLSNEKQGVYGL